MKTGKLKVAIPLIVLAVAAVAYIVHFDFGTLSSFGWSTISMICPLGSLSTLLATKIAVPHVVVALVIGIVVMVVFGRAFCSWVCPVPVVSKLREIFSGKKHAKAHDSNEAPEAHEAQVLESAAKNAVSTSAEEPRAKTDEEEAGEFDLSIRTSGCTGCQGADAKGVGTEASACALCGKKRGNKVDSRHVILGGSLLTAAVFGFPVFCLICPIGLTFGTIFLVINLFGAGDMTWSVVVVPLLLLVEVVFFRKWCSTFCPLSAMASLLNKAGKFFRPQISDDKCVETSTDWQCGMCATVCPEGIDPRHPELSATDMSECTRCRKCVESCPKGAIKIAVWAGDAKTPEAAKPSLSVSADGGTDGENQ